MTRSAKDIILERVRDAQRLSGTPNSVEVPRRYQTRREASVDELRELLIDRLVDYKAEVHRATAEILPRVLAEIVRERGVTTLRHAPGVEPVVLSDLDPAVDVVPDSKDIDPRVLNDVDAVLTGSKVTCAQTGTICLQADDYSGRRALTLVPDRHICLVPIESVVVGVPEMIARLSPDSPVTMISGPSATSDIELSRVEGVHGPRDLIVVVVG